MIKKYIFCVIFDVRTAYAVYYIADDTDCSNSNRRICFVSLCNIYLILHLNSQQLFHMC